MEITLIRHTTPAVAKGTCYGQTDLLLAESFPDEARKLTFTRKPDIIYTSPLQRCRKLADRLAAQWDISLVEDIRLMELHFGQWEMKRWDDINTGELFAWMSHYESARCPGGESYVDLIERVREFTVSLLSSGYNAPCIVTHGGVIRSFHVILQSMSLNQSMDLILPYGSITRMHAN